ncbi:MAG: peroxidase-related enzyme [Pseudomonadota bacterium]
MAFNTGMERPLLDMQQVIMRSDDSPLTVAQRELIAAYVSALNRCAYCRGAHTACAVAFGVEEGLVDQLLENIDDAKIDEALKPLFRYAKKLTLDLHTVVQADADAVFAAGWSSRALYDVVSVCCVFNFMNRFTNGLGLADIPAQFGKEGEILKRGGYGVADILKLK